MRNKLLMCFALSAGMALPALGQSAAPSQAAAATAQPDQAHLLAVRDMLRVMKFENWIRHMYEPGPAQAQTPRRQLGQLIFGRLSDDEILKTFAPVYARYFSEQEARALERAFASPLGQHYCFTCRPGKRMELPESDYQAMADFLNTHEATIYTERSPKYDAAVANVLRATIAQYFAEMWRTTTSNAAQAAQTMRQSAGQPVLPPRAPIGIAFLDSLAEQMGAIALNQHLLVWQLEADLKALGEGDMMLPADLTAVGPITRKLNNVELINVRIAAFIRESQRLIAEYHAALQKMEMPDNAAFMASTRSLRERQQQASFNYGEHKRALNLTAYRMLTFAQSRLGKSRVKGDQVVMANPQDVATYESLRTEMREQAARAGQIATELELAFTGWPDDTYPPRPRLSDIPAPTAGRP